MSSPPLRLLLYRNNGLQRIQFPRSPILGEGKVEALVPARGGGDSHKVLRPFQTDWSRDKDGPVTGGTIPQQDCSVMHTSCIKCKSNIRT